MLFMRPLLAKTILAGIARSVNGNASTVLRVWNDHPAISAAVKKQGRHTRKLNGQTNKNPFALRLGQTHISGVIILCAASIFFGPVIQGIEKSAFAFNYNMRRYLCSKMFHFEKNGLESFLCACVDDVPAFIFIRILNKCVGAKAHLPEIPHSLSILIYPMKTCIRSVTQWEPVANF